MDGSAAEHGPQGVSPVTELGHSTEVPAPAANRPEEIRLALLTGLHHRTRGENNLGREQIVDRQPMLAKQPSDPPPKVRPAMPVVETSPPVVARPCACAA